MDKSASRRGAAPQGSDVDALTADRDRWIRLFNRLEGAVARHHGAQTDPVCIPWVNDWDEALWAAHDRILKDAATPEPKSAAPVAAARPPIDQSSRASGEGDG